MSKSGTLKMCHSNLKDKQVIPQPAKVVDIPVITLENFKSQKSSPIISIDDLIIVDYQKGFNIYPKTEKQLEYWYAIKNKTGYVKAVEDQMKDHIMLSQPNYYYNHTLKCVKYAVKYCFVPNDYSQLAELMKTNSCFFEVIPKDSHVKPYFDLEIEEDNITSAKCKRLLNLFIKIVIYEFKKQLDVNLDKKDIRTPN